MDGRLVAVAVPGRRVVVVGVVVAREHAGGPPPVGHGVAVDAQAQRPLYPVPLQQLVFPHVVVLFARAVRLLVVGPLVGPAAVVGAQRRAVRGVAHLPVVVAVRLAVRVVTHRHKSVVLLHRNSRATPAATKRT